MPDEQKILIALNDPILRSYLTAENEEQRRTELELVAGVRARGTIERVLAGYARGELSLTADDAADLAAAITVRLIHKLMAALESSDEAIRQFDDYVARLTYNAVNDFRRRRYPERNRLKRRLRYVLTHDRRFALWDSPAGLVAGLQQWRDATEIVTNRDFSKNPVTPALVDSDHPDEAIQALFINAGGPLLFETVTDTLARLWGVHEATIASIDTPVADTSPSQDVEYETRETLSIVWDEIQSLPAAQRAALLLNMRDAFGLNAAVLLPLTGVATFEEIANAIGIHPDALLRLWNQMPLPDDEIASVFGITRQQVINLRKSARDRLRRRLTNRQRPRKV